MPPGRRSLVPELAGTRNMVCTALGLTAPGLELADKIGPLQAADPALEQFRQLAGSAHPQWWLRDDILYRVTQDCDYLVIPKELREKLF